MILKDSFNFSGNQEEFNHLKGKQNVMSIEEFALDITPSIQACNRNKWW